MDSKSTERRLREAGYTEDEISLVLDDCSGASEMSDDTINGPWTFDGHYVRQGGELPQGATQTTAVACVLSYCGYPARLARGQLMSAAPQLLAAAKDAEAWISAFANGLPRPKDGRKILKALHEAIDKAQRPFP